MKKLIYTFVAALTLVACTPDNGVSSKVRLAVSFEDEQQSTKGQQRISAVDNGSIIEVKWEEGDVLYWNKGEGVNTSNPFQIVSGIGEQTAFFECETMIGSKDKFTLYYNGATTFSENPISDNQKSTIKNGYTSINNDYLLYIAENCEVGKTITLKPQFQLLGIMVKKDNSITENFVPSIVIAPTGNYNNSATTRPEYGYICSVGTYNTNQEFTPTALSNDFITYYIVLPTDYNIQDKEIWLTTEGWGHPCSTNKSLEKVSLSVDKATIIALNVSKNLESTGITNIYKIDAVAPTQN